MYDIRQFKPSLYLVLILGISGFCLATATPALWVFAMAGIGLNGWLVSSNHFTPLPRWLANGATLLALIVCGQGFFNATHAILPIGQFLVLMQVIKLWEQRANRDYAQLLVLSLLLMVAAAITTASLLFGLLFVLYLFVSLYCCLLFHLKAETDQAKAALAIPETKLSPGMLRHDERFLGSSMRRLTGLIATVSIFLAVAVFLLFPRGRGSGIIGPLNVRPTQALTGFRNHMDFQQIAKITQNQEIVADVRVWRNDELVRGTETLYLRGMTLDAYSGKDGFDGGGPWQWARSSWGDATRYSGRGDEQLLSEPNTDVIFRQNIHLRPTGTTTLFAMAGPFKVTPSTNLNFRFSPRDEVLQAMENLQRRVEYDVYSRGTVGNYQSTSPNRWVDDSNEFRPRRFGYGYGRRARRYESVIDPRIAEYARRPEVSGTNARGPLFEQLAPRTPAMDNYGNALVQEPDPLDAEIAANIERHLQTEFQYTLDLTDTRRLDDEDPMVAFLYRFKRGHCEYFAGAMTLLCQSLGMEARVVIGFKCDEYNAVGDYYIVRQSHAHAWVEVNTTDGWKVYDPTSGILANPNQNASIWKRMGHFFNYLEYKWANSVVAYDQDSRDNLVSKVEQQWQSTTTEGSRAASRFQEWLDYGNFWLLSSSALSILIKLMCAAFFAAVGWYLWERMRLRRRVQRIGIESLPPEDQVRLARQLVFYDDLIRLLERHGIVREPHLTPKEFSSSLTYLPADVYSVIGRLTELFYRIRYGRAQLQPAQRRRLQTVVERLGEAFANSRRIQG